MKEAGYFDNIRLFYLFGMACRIQSIKPPCAYNVEGIQRIILLDSADFIGFAFDGDGLYNNCLVTDIYRGGDFAELQTPDSAKYSSNSAGVHNLETFIGELSAFSLANLHLATKRRFIAFFQTNAGKYFTFGYRAGAFLTYANQTAESLGSLVTLSADTNYPLFEVNAAAFIQAPTYSIYDIEYVKQYQ